MFNSSWGAQIEVPYDFRSFQGGQTTTTTSRTHNWSQLGDIRIEGIYTGFFADLSAGVTFGLKLPTGSYTEDPDFVDRDTQIGTGSTDILLGGFYRGNMNRNQTMGLVRAGIAGRAGADPSGISSRRGTRYGGRN